MTSISNEAALEFVGSNARACSRHFPIPPEAFWVRCSTRKDRVDLGIADLVVPAGHFALVTSLSLMGPEQYAFDVGLGIGLQLSVWSAHHEWRGLHIVPPRQNWFCSVRLCVERGYRIVPREPLQLSAQWWEVTQSVYDRHLRPWLQS